MKKFVSKVNHNENITSRSEDYINGFIQAFEKLDENYIDKKVLTLKKISQESQYLQGLAEAILYKYLVAQGFSPQTDVKVNGTDKDVDLVIERNGIKINIEVKCPVINDKSPDTLYMSTGHRFSNVKEEHNSVFDPVLQEFIKNFNNNPNKTYAKIECEKLDDNKLKDYLKSAQSKFALSQNNECNVLFLALITSDFIGFFDYITNSQTGLFSNNPYVAPEIFDKIDCIILSNIISGHYKHKLDMDIWDMKNYLTFVLPNLTKHDNKMYVVPTESEQIVVELFGNRTYEFMQFEEEFYKLNPQFPRAIQLPLPAYIARDFKLLSEEYIGKNVIPLKSNTGNK